MSSTTSELVNFASDYKVRRTKNAAGEGIQHVRLDVGSGATESVVSGSLPVTVASLPLPTGGATAALQTSGNASLTSIDGKITAVNTGAVVVASSALPSGGSTAALQTSGNASLTSIDGKITACDTGNIAGGVNVAGYNGTNYQYARIDTSTRSWQVIDYAHHEIHSGSSFHCHYSNTCTNTNEMTIIALNTPDTTKYIHMFPYFSSSAGATAHIYEISDLDVDEGTQLAVWNRNRNSATTSTVTSIETVPVANKVTSFNEAQAAGATLDTTNEIWAKNLGAATAGLDTSGESRDSEEWILKRNTQYAFVIRSTSNDDNIHDIALNWYEHTDQAA